MEELRRREPARSEFSTFSKKDRALCIHTSMPIRQFRRPDGSTAASARPINSSSQDHGSILSTVYSPDSTAARAVAAAGTTIGCPVTMVYLDLLPTVLFLLNYIAGWMKDLGS